MNQEQENFQALSSRIDQLTGLVENLARAVAATLPPLPPAPPNNMEPSGSGPDIDQEFTINQVIPTRSLESQRGSRRSSLLVGIGPLLTPARPETQPTPPTEPPPINPPSVPVMVATEITIKEEEKLTGVSVRGVRRLQRLYRAYKKQHTHSKNTLADFIKYSVLVSIRSNEYALGTDLSRALTCVEDLKYVGDVPMLNALARYYRSHSILSQGMVAMKMYKEVDRIRWPPEYYDHITKSWAINPDGFHLVMYSKTLEWTLAMRETVQFIYHCATQDELRYLLPPISYGSRHEPGLIQMAMRGLGELSESITTLITQKRLELLQDIVEWEELLNEVFNGYASQSRTLAQQRAQATKSEKVDDLWKKSQEEDQRSEKEQQLTIIPRPRIPHQYIEHRRGAMIHALEEEVQKESDVTLALTESTIKDEDESIYYSVDELAFETENEEELFALTSGAPPKDISGLPCFSDYEGSCKLGSACPFVKSHGNRQLMKERSSRLITQVLKSRYGGREVIGEIISEYQKQNNLTSPTTQDYRQNGYQASSLKPLSRENNRHEIPRDIPPHRSLALRPQDAAQPTRPGSMIAMRGGGEHGRGGGRLVTYGGRGNMGRAQYTSHLLHGEEQGEHDQVEDVTEEDTGKLN